MTALLVVISVILSIVGVFSLSQATMGVGVICLGVAFGIWARISQAAEHRKSAISESARPAATPTQVVN